MSIGLTVGLRHCVQLSREIGGRSGGGGVLFSVQWWYEVEGWNESAGCGYPLYLQSTCTVDDERIFTEP